MVDLDTLQKQALADCLAFAGQHLTGELRAEPAAAPASEALEWDPIELRYVVDQTVVLYRRYGQFEVLLDGEDRMVGYVDHDKWEQCRWEPLSDGEALTLARGTGLVPARLRLTGSRKGEGDCLELSLEEPAGGKAPGLVVRINPARRAVISVLPADGQAP